MTEIEYLDRRQKEVSEELADINRKRSLLKGEGDHDDRLSPVLSVPKMMTIREAAKVVHLAENYVRYLCRTNAIVYVRAGNKYLVNFEKLLEFLNRGGKEETGNG